MDIISTIARSTVKTTTPNPSLNSDSPSILNSKDSAIPAFLSIAKTAIGSVGDIIEPNNMQTINERSIFNN